MTSTERRRQRDQNLLAEWAGFQVERRVTVRRANGAVMRTLTTSGPFSQNGQGAYIRVKGIPGNTALHRVTKGWGRLDVLP